MEHLVQSWDYFVRFVKPLILVIFTKKLSYFGLKQGLIPYPLHTIKPIFFCVILISSTQCTQFKIKIISNELSTTNQIQFNNIKKVRPSLYILIRIVFMYIKELNLGKMWQPP